MDDHAIFGGRGTEVFAGIPVSDFRRSLDWYQRFFGSPPAFRPNAREAVWAIGERRWIYIIAEPDRSGGTIQTIMCDGLETVIDEIASRGIDFGEDERPAEGVRKVVYRDPDGNEIGVGRVPAG